MHTRATTDQSTVLDTLRLLADETLACGQRIRLLIGEDRELMEIWQSFEQVSIQATCHSYCYHYLC